MATRNSTQNRISRYVQGGETDIYSTRLGWWERELESFQTRSDDLIVPIQPKHDKRPDKFAADYFGRSTLAWIVLQYNNIVDINEEFTAGRKIRVPLPSRVTLDFLTNNTGGNFIQENI